MGPLKYEMIEKNGAHQSGGRKSVYQNFHYYDDGALEKMYGGSDHSHLVAKGLPLEVHHSHGMCVSHGHASQKRNGHCYSGGNPGHLAASQTSQSPPGQDGRLWKPKVHHSQFPTDKKGMHAKIVNKRRTEKRTTA